MGLTVIQNDVLATRVGRAAGSEGLSMGMTGTVTPGVAPAYVPHPAVKEEFDGFVGTTGGPTLAGHVSSRGRGTTDTDITYITLHNASGTECFVFPDGAGTGITVQTTRP